MNKFLLFLKWFGIAVCFLIIIMLALLALNSVLPGSAKIYQAQYMVAIAGVALSLFFSYAEGIRLKFAELPASIKAMVNGLSVLMVAIVIYIMNCVGMLKLAGLSCSIIGVQTLLSYVGWALVGNQVTDIISIDAADVLALKAKLSS